MSNSKLEERFLMLILELAPSIVIVREYAAIEGRRFKFDFWLPESNVLIEIQGGTFTGGRHTRGVGMAADCEKSRLAQMQGYVVLCYTGQQITKSNVTELLEFHSKRKKTIARKRKPTQNKQEYTNGQRKKANVRKQK